MALKDWKKSGTLKNPMWVKGHNRVVINSGNNYFVVFINGEPFATIKKTHALKYAKAYMRKH